MLFNNNLKFEFGQNGKLKFGVCVTEPWTDATWYGAEGTNGTVDPSVTITEQLLYALKWKADGTFIIRFGSLGDEQVFDVPDIKIRSKYSDTPVLVVWNETTSQYESQAGPNESVLASDLIALQIAGTPQFCFSFEVEPVEIISYDYVSEIV